MSTVFIRKASYEYNSLKRTIFELLDKAAGEKIKAHSRVVLKPNLLGGAPPEKAMVTHPLVIRAVAEYVIEKGARPQISDSPATAEFEKVLKESGIIQALEGLPVDLLEFKKSVTVETVKPFNKLEIAEDAVKADVLINLPKLKTHSQMLMTLAVKNLFGCVVGIKKPEWHFRAGIDRELFAKLLVLIYAAIKPGITILDGILAMEGQGPGRNGTPRELGILMASESAPAIDSAVCRVIGLQPRELLTNQICGELGLLPETLEIDGELPAVRDFKLPSRTPLVFGPGVMHGFLRSHIAQRPVADKNICRGCGECWKYCPAHAISKSSKRGKKIAFDYDRCIRCYCCLEVCPHAALSARETLAGKILRQIIRFKTGKRNI